MSDDNILVNRRPTVSKDAPLEADDLKMEDIKKRHTTLEFNIEEAVTFAASGANVVDLPNDLSISLDDTIHEVATDPVTKKIIISLEY